MVREKLQLSFHLQTQWSCQGDTFTSCLLLLHVGGVKVEREQQVGEGSILIYALVVENSVGIKETLGFRVRVQLLFRIRNLISSFLTQLVVYFKSCDELYSELHGTDIKKRTAVYNVLTAIWSHSHSKWIEMRIIWSKILGFLRYGQSNQHYPTEYVVFSYSKDGQIRRIRNQKSEYSWAP